MPDNIYDTDLQMQMYTDFLFLQILIIKVFSNYDQNTDPKASWVFFFSLQQTTLPKTYTSISTL